MNSSKSLIAIRHPTGSFEYILNPITPSQTLSTSRVLSLQMGAQESRTLTMHQHSLLKFSNYYINYMLVT
jgi:hypothetical protein